MNKKILVVLVILVSSMFGGCKRQNIDYTARYSDKVDISFTLNLDEDVMTAHSVPKSVIDNVVVNVSGEFGYSYINDGYSYTFSKSFTNSAYSQTLANRGVEESYGFFFYKIRITYLIPISSGIVYKTINDMETALVGYGITRADITGDIEYKYDTPFRSVSTDGILIIDGERYVHTFRGSYEDINNTTIEIVRNYPNTTTWYICIVILGISIVTVSIIISKNRYKKNQGDNNGSQDNAK